MSDGLTPGYYTTAVGREAGAAAAGMGYPCPVRLSESKQRFHDQTVLIHCVTRNERRVNPWPLDNCGGAGGWCRGDRRGGGGGARDAVEDRQELGLAERNLLCNLSRNCTKERDTGLWIKVGVSVNSISSYIISYHICTSYF